MGKPTLWFLTRSDKNRAVQSQKQARSLKFWILVEEDLYYPSSENKGLISFAVTAKLIYVFVFTYADCWFSHEAAHLMLPKVLVNLTKNVDWKVKSYPNLTELNMFFQTRDGWSV